MNKEFIPYEQALELKELGFNPTPIGGFKQDAVFYYENGNLYYDYKPMYSSTSHLGQILAPLYQQAFRWFREKYNLVNEINVYSTTDGYSFSFKVLCKKYTPFIDANDAWTTYEEAELACLKKLIKIIKG